MGWTNEDGRCEGWAAVVFPDGRVSVGSTNGGALVATVGPDGAVQTRTVATVGEQADVLDGRTATGWRGHCECGWQGPTWTRVLDSVQEEFDNRRAYDPDPREWGHVPDRVEQAIHQEWKSHLEPVTVTTVRTAAAALRLAQAELDQAVHAARADGQSWARIGDAAGMTRQSAHERWGR
ncbi:hypothetical protein ACIBG7_26975 [Nonomuraea sp. NPDC050328]|uniref:hypothetical protein n=1 Tax=Nonomuraea sp. NPDC050328 TaxID=3364361 RepID=UPI0037A865F7